MLLNAEQNAEKESEQFMKMTARFKNRAALYTSSQPSINNGKEGKSRLLNNNSENEEEASYKWGDDEDEES